ncbi:translation initiation factor 2 [Pichia kluyveri]|uniref:Translation initiation factor IF-2, mitochondrial n=1 Tax=Pichia kluyveri TaxID=36015 RepID=A0AAV5R0T0_PICKL|nr:translation initiation factor 2 [Pichia kluyveri]
MMLQRGIRACFTTNKSLNVYGTVSRSFSITSSVSAFKRPSRFKPIKEELKIEEKEETKQEIKQKTQNSSSRLSPKLVKSNQSDKSSISELIDQKVNAKLNEEKKQKNLKVPKPVNNSNNKEAKKDASKLPKDDKKNIDSKYNKSKNESKNKKSLSNDKFDNKKESSGSSMKVMKVKKRKAPVKADGSKYKLDIPTFLSVANFATILKVRVPELLEKLEELGFENITNEHILDVETAELIAQEYGFEVNRDDNLGADLFPATLSSDPKKLVPRSPVVTIMGHVDHGKTTILDYLRKSSIVKGEFGGITQHIGAFVVKTPVSKKEITFLDTPGHAAFLKMRERGANITDIIILVVAAEDSVKPQTIEAIKHAKAAGVPIIIAINKCDKEQANPDKVVADLSMQGIDVEDYGGDTPVVRVSGKTGLGMKELEETIVTVAELLDLKTEENGVVEGWVLESQVKKGLGNVATFLVKKGKLKAGTIIVSGTTFCKVRVMKDEHGKVVKMAKPSHPVEISGWKEVPEAGEYGIQAKDESFAKKVIVNREKRQRMMEEASQIEEMNQNRIKAIQDSKKNEQIQAYQMQGLTLEEIKELEPELFDEESNKVEMVNFIIKADVSGSAEAVKQSIEGLGNDEVKSHVIFEDVGAPTESDIARARDANAHVLAFNVKVPKEIMNTASKSKITIKEYNVIYHLIEDVLKILTSKLPPIYETKVIAKVSIKQLFEISLKGKEKMVIAGSRVTEGTFKRNHEVRLIRDGDTIYTGKVKQLKIVKNDVNEVLNGGDCGISLEGDPELKEGDIIESIEKIPIERHL